MTQRIGILCIGNILMLDEGVGPRVARELVQQYRFPENVEILDRGTLGMALLSDIKNLDVILVVDAVDNTGKPPGTVVTFLPEDIAPSETPRGAHSTRLVDVLETASLLGYSPEVHCLGVQVQNMNPTDYSIGLTPQVEASLPFLLHCVIEFLKKREVSVKERVQYT